MEKFDLILCELSELCYGIESLKTTLENIEVLHSENKEIGLETSLNVCIRNLKSLGEDMGKAIIDLDSCIMSCRKKFASVDDYEN